MSKHRRDSGSAYWQWLCLCLGISVYLFMHFSTGSVAPISDDFRQIEFTKNIDSVLDCFQPDSFGMFRPVKSLIFYAVVQNGLGHQTFQWIGAAMAVLCLLVTLALLRRILSNSEMAVGGALLWLFLPLNVVIFNWASALNIGAYYFFSILSLLLAESYLGSSKRLSLLLCCVAYLWALFSYEMALSVPLLIGLYVVVFRGESVKLSTCVYLIVGLVMVTLGYLAARSTLLSGVNSTISANPLIAPSDWWLLSWASSLSYLEHMRFLFWPFSGFEFLIPFDPEAQLLLASLTWACIGACALLSIKAYSRFRYFCFALLWSAIALATILNVIPIGAGPLAEYYMPLAAFGWLVAGLALIQTCVSKRSIRVLIVLVLVVLFGLEVSERQLLWSSETSLYTGVVEASDRAHVPYALLAQIRKQEGRLPEALQLIEQAMEMAPDKADYAGVWLRILQQSALPENRLDYIYKEAMETYPDAPPVLLAYGDYFFEKQEPEHARVLFERALTKTTTKHTRAVALNSLGLLEIQQGNISAAKNYFREACALKPYDPSIRSNFKHAQDELSDASR